MKKAPAIEFSMIFFFEKPHSLLKNQTPKQSFVGMQHPWVSQVDKFSHKIFRNQCIIYVVLVVDIFKSDATFFFTSSHFNKL